METKFDQGIEYVFEKHDDPEMLRVYDKFGAKTEVFANRFEIIEEEA